MAKKSDLHTIRKGHVFAKDKKTKLDFEYKKGPQKFVLDISVNKIEPTIEVVEELRHVKSSITEWRPKLEKPADKLTAAEKKKYEADTKKLNTAINNGLKKVIDNKVDDLEVIPVVIEKNVQQVIQIEKEVNGWKETGKKSFDLYVDLSIQALRIFVKNYSKTL